MLRDFHARVDFVDKVSRTSNNRRRERPVWPTAALAVAADGTNNSPPNASLDPRRRSPDGSVVLEPSAGAAVTVYAAWPEPSFDQPAMKAVAATRFRLANERLGIVQQGATESITANLQQRDAHRAASGILQDGTLLTLTRCDDVPFGLGAPNQAAWRRYPLPGSEVYARREPMPDVWPNPPDGNLPLTTLRPPLVDVVVWARRPGEATRTAWIEETLGYSPNNPRRMAAACPREITLRRPRAQAGPDEAVRLEYLQSSLMMAGLFQYSLFRLDQRVARTPPPAIAGVYAVLAGKSEIFPSALTGALANSNPAILRVDKLTHDLEQASLTLVANQLFAPRLFFPGSQELCSQTVLIANDDGVIPAFADIGTKANVFLISNILPSPDAKWTDLGVDNRYLSIGTPDALTKLLVPAPKTCYILLLRYTKDQAGGVFKVPDQPLAAIKVTSLDANSDIVTPKMAVALLCGPPAEGAPDTDYDLAGYGRLDDSDFSPIQPQPATDDRVAWIRTAILQSINRLTTKPAPDDSAFAFDVVVYGPGGELIPTESGATSSSRM